MMEKNFIILMSFALLAFGSLFYVLSIYSGEDLTGMLSAISGDYKKRAGSSFLTSADEGSKLSASSGSRNCPMSTKEGKLIVNAPSDATVRILYAETGAELECRTGGFTKNICRSQFTIKAYKSDSKVFEKTIFLGAGQVATVDVDLKPGTSNLPPCDGAVSETSAAEELPTESLAQEDVSVTQEKTESTSEELSTTTTETTPMPAETQSVVTESTTLPQETISSAEQETSAESQVPLPDSTPTESPIQTSEENTPVEETQAE
jgi:hypothetical protein